MPIWKISHWSFCERELRQLLSSKTCIKATDTINKKGLKESYMVSYRVTRTDKPITIVEYLIIPAVMDMAGTMLGEKAKKNFTDNVFIKQHCFTTHQWHGRRCFETITGSLTCNEFYALQLDESTDVMSLAQLLVYVRYFYGGANEDILLQTNGTPDNRRGYC